MGNTVDHLSSAPDLDYDHANTPLLTCLEKKLFSSCWMIQIPFLVTVTRVTTLVHSLQFLHVTSQISQILFALVFTAASLMQTNNKFFFYKNTFHG